MRRALLLLPWFLSACLFGGASRDDSGDTTERDIAAYEAERASLEADRVPIISKKATEIRGAGTRVFWLEHPTFAPVLRSYDFRTDARVEYTFSVGQDAYDYRASREAVATPAREGDKVTYRLYDAAKPGALLAAAEMEAPKDEQRWWAYNVDGRSIYVVRTDSPPRLLRFSAGDKEWSKVFDLEEVGIRPGLGVDIGIDGNTGAVLEGGRAWRLDMRAKRATFVGNRTEARAVAFDDAGMAILTARGPFFYTAPSGPLSDLGAEITGNGYRMNETFASAHHFAEGLARCGDTLAYIGQAGLIVYDRASGRIRPVLLHVRDNSVVYRNPVLLEDGTLIVTGLESSSGSVGAEGTTYRLRTAYCSRRAAP